MALKPTIYKFRISLSDLDRHVYDSLELTVAQHPSESIERMMARVLAFCLNAQEHLAFTKGLSTPDEPDVWCKSLDDQLLLWIDIGEPSVDRLKKASRQAPCVKVYSFNSKSDTWWQQEKAALNKLAVEVWQFPWGDIQTLAGLVERTMEYAVTITEGTILISADKSNCSVSYNRLN